MGAIQYYDEVSFRRIWRSDDNESIVMLTTWPRSIGEVAVNFVGNQSVSGGM